MRKREKEMVTIIEAVKIIFLLNSHALRGPTGEERPAPLQRAAGLLDTDGEAR